MRYTTKLYAYLFTCCVLVAVAASQLAPLGAAELTVIAIVAGYVGVFLGDGCSVKKTFEPLAK
jgi:hypothetical protein